MTNRSTLGRRLLIGGTIAAATFLAPSALGQGRAHTNEDLLRDLIHYVMIDRADLAAATGEELLARGLKPTEFVKLVEESQEQARFEAAMGRALKKTELEPTAGKLLRTLEQGRLDRARDPAEIARNIALLTGNARGKVLARQRLEVAGEYALPQLLDALFDRSNAARQAEVQQVLVRLGRHAVAPLCAALPRVNPTQQEQVVDVLGLIDYRTSVPFIADIRTSATINNVRAACDRALTRLTGSAEMDAASAYRELAEGYYAEKSELTSFPGEDHQLLWNYNPGVGLVMVPIRTPVFHEAMAMRLAERSLTLSGSDARTLALWVAANFSREIDTPAGYENPAYGPERREAMYYAVAAGAPLCQTVLARAIDTRDTALARRAIEAVQKTAGGKGLWGDSADRRPLVEALGYPNRRVQYDAALAIAGAQPAEAFPGCERVVPTLAGAIRDASSRFAVVVSPTLEAYQSVRRILEKAKFNVLPAASTLAESAGAIAEAPAIDVIVTVNHSGEGVPAFLDEVRGTPKTAASPVLVLTGAEAYDSLRRRFERDLSVTVRPSASSEDALGRAVEELMQAWSGGTIEQSEARSYAERSVRALRDLAVAGSTVLNVGDAALPLIGALGTTQGSARLEVAEVLARIGQARAQVALLDAALAAGGEERIALLGKVADSAKRFGNMLESRQVSRVVELAMRATGPEGTAAAALMGALNLPNPDVLPLILPRSG